MGRGKLLEHIALNYPDLYARLIDVGYLNFLITIGISTGCLVGHDEIWGYIKENELMHSFWFL